MKKQIIISTIGLILVLSMAATAGQENSRRMSEIEQMRLEVEKLQLEAMEHELLARQLRMEAARINLRVRTDMMHIQMQREQQRDIERTQRRIDELRVASERAEKDGQVDKAKYLWKESKQLTKELEWRIKGRQREEHMDRMHARMKELAGALEEAERHGRERQADELREEMGNLEREIHKHERDTEAEQLEREIHHLLAEAEKAEDEGRGDEADAMRHEAEQLERRLHELFEEDSEDEEDVPDELLEKIESLRRQLAELNEVVEHLRNKLK
jgi:hypothetical protein